MKPLKPCSSCGRIILGEEFVIVPMREYRRLLAHKRASKGPGPASATRGVGPRSSISRNPKLSKFITERAPKMFLRELVEAVRAEFGEGSPSQSSIHRFLKKVHSDREAGSN